MHLAVPKYDVLVIILKSSDHFFSFYRMNTPNNLELVHNNIVPIYIYLLPISNSIFTSNINIIFMSQLKIYIDLDQEK